MTDKIETHLNLEEQEYRGIKLRLINRNYVNRKAKRFTLFNTSQNVWIPNYYLKEDGTIKDNINLDFIFKTNKVKRRVKNAKAGIETLRKQQEEAQDV